MTNAVNRHALSLDELEAFVARVEQLSYSNISPADFFSELTKGLCLRLSFASLRITLFHAEGQTVLSEVHGTSLHPLLAPERDRFKPGESRSDRHSDPSGSVQLTLDHCFLHDEILRIEALADSRSQLEPASLNDLLGTCAVLAGNFLIRSTGRDLQAQLGDRQRVAGMIAQLADAETGPQAESDLCRVLQATLEVDRVLLLWTMPHHARLLGTSTSTEIDRNSQAIRLLERIAAEISQPGERSLIVMGDGSSPLPSDLQSSVDAYVEETGVRRMRWVPIHRDDVAREAPLGFLLLEHFSGDWPDTRQQRVFDLAEPHARQAARRCLLAVNHSPLSQLRIILSDRKKWYGVWLGGIALVLFLLVAIRKDLEIPVDGTLKPEQRITVFAPVQGIVEQVPVQHGSEVSTGETLFVLRAPDLEIEERRISGEMATIRSRLDSLKSARIRSRASGSRPGSETDLSAEESDLEAQLKGLTAQLALVRERMQQLVIKSPLSGQVDRWDLNQALANRPVTHGQYLCDVLDVKGDWVVELEIPDDVIGYVLQAQQQGACRVTYLFRTNAGQKFASRIDNISNSAQLNRNGAPVVMARMPAGTVPEPDLRVGAGVLARIHCGRRSIGFIYLRELLEFFQKTFWI